ncbi:MAG: hypothetical protein L7F77_12485 [Candidatus Magnetominusculus sp. LBB02]|nr:hypothetical protein [Candidatus Magnetominusculus sp. LBB02]
MTRWIAIMALLLVTVPNVQADEDSGYDANTEVTLSGVVSEAAEPLMGPYVFTITAADKTYKVLSGPWWFIAKIGFAPKAGTALDVTGSKYYDRKGELCISAYYITVGSKTYRFRDERSQMPLWHGQRRQ